MRAVLVLKEMPKTCKECPCQLMFVCVPTDEDIDEYVYPNETKPDWCPLRPLPQKYGAEKDMYSVEDYNYSLGRDDCIDEITGETE